MCLSLATASPPLSMPPSYANTYLIVRARGIAKKMVIAPIAHRAPIDPTAHGAPLVEAMAPAAMLPTVSTTWFCWEHTHHPAAKLRRGVRLNDGLDERIAGDVAQAGDHDEYSRDEEPVRKREGDERQAV